jgi:ABC-2 type transport system permease protein
VKNTWIILKKELRSYFDSSLAYIFIVIFLVLCGAYVAANLFLANVASLQTFFDVAPLLLLLFAPAVTMRLIAEEKRLGTYEILNTRPVGPGEIVRGKFLAAWVLVISALVPTMLYVITVGSLGHLDSGTVIGGYIGLILLGGVFAAVGIFGSSLSTNQIVALIISFVLGFVLFALDKVLLYVPLSMVGIVEYVGVGHHYATLSRGVLDSRAIVYYLSLIAFFLMLASFSASQEPGQSLWRWRDFRLGQRFTRVLMVAGILLFVNLLAVRNFVRVDMTENRVFTLSEVTKKFLSSLDDTFLVRAYFSPDLPPPYHGHRKAVQQILEEYRAYSRGRLHYKFINPFSGTAEEQEALREGITPIQVRVIKNNRFQRARAYVGLAFSYEDKQEHVPVLTSLERLEYEITASLKKMTSPGLRSVGILTGVNGPVPEEMHTFLGALGRQHAVVPVELGKPGLTADRVAVLLVVAPGRKLTDVEKIQLDQYLMSGGRIAFLMNAVGVDPLTRRAHASEENLDDLFDVYGWILNKDLVADARCAPFILQESSEDQAFSTDVLYPFYPVASDFNPSESVVRNLPPVAFSYVSSIDTRLASIRGVSARTIVSSSRQSRRFAADSVDADPRRPIDPAAYTDASVPLAALVEGSFRSAFADVRDPSLRDAVTQVTGNKLLTRSPETRVVVVGDGDFVLDSKLHGHDNVAFAINLVDWLVADTVLTTIRSRDVAPQPLTELPEDTKTFAKYFSFASPPGLVVALGLLWLVVKSARRRRHKHSY